MSKSRSSSTSGEPVRSRSKACIVVTPRHDQVRDDLPQAGGGCSGRNSSGTTAGLAVGEVLAGHTLDSGEEAR